MGDYADLRQEFEWYLENQDTLVKKHNGKVIVIKNKKVIGVYNDNLTAVLETEKIYTAGTFLVQKCTPGNEAYTSTYHSRVTFS